MGMSSLMLAQHNQWVTFSMGMSSLMLAQHKQRYQRVTFSTAASSLENQEYRKPKGDATIQNLRFDHILHNLVLDPTKDGSSSFFFVGPCLGIAKFIGTPFEQCLYQTKPIDISISGGWRNRRWSTVFTSLRLARVTTCGGESRYPNSKLNARSRRCCSCAWCFIEGQLKFNGTGVFNSIVMFSK